jgi:hypothetical protein
MTPFETKCGILGHLWVNYRDDEAMKEFIVYHDLGLPAAYLLDMDMVSPTDQVVALVDETFQHLLDGFGLDDIGWKSLDAMITASDE